MEDYNNILDEPDFKGAHYKDVLNQIHRGLKPRTYFEIGVNDGNTLKLSSCKSIGIDPNFKIHSLQDFQFPALHLFKMTSDEFFFQHSPSEIFQNSIDLAFLDGMHRCEFLLRDFLNTERHCRPNSVVALHDCLPLDVALTSRVPWGSDSEIVNDRRRGWWTGDVWRTALFLKRRRPDLTIYALDAPPTGLILITNLNPYSNMKHGYFETIRTMFDMDLSQIGIKGLFDEMKLTSTSEIMDNTNLTKNFGFEYCEEVDFVHFDRINREWMIQDTS